jgi:protein-tyrosine sulfotransferase
MSVDELPGRRAEVMSNSRNAPIIVMAYAGSGADRLRSVLSAFPELACTQGTGILPLCHHAVSTWQTVDGNAGRGVSPLAAASLRALSAGLMTAVLARHGGKRWCEFTTAAPAAAQTFARICPQARFLVAHCRADTAVRAIVGSSRWGLEGPEFAPYVSAHPASSVAALAAYWVAHTVQQLEFEQAHPEKCHRVHLEDLTANAAQARLDISDFLALDGRSMPPSFTEDDAGNRPAGEDSPATGLPIDRIPPPLLAQVNELHRSLGYPPVTAAGA